MIKDDHGWLGTHLSHPLIDTSYILRQVMDCSTAVQGFLDCHPINFATQLISKILTRIRDYWERDKERERGAMKGS